MQPSNGDERIYVQGEVGAKAYLVAPGNTVTLWDSERQAIYIKTVSPAGIPSMERLNYTVEAPKTAPIENGDNSIAERVKALETAVNGLKTQFNKIGGVNNESVADDSTV